jgi:hypothetical protein
MIKRIINQQQEERDLLLSLPYIKRMEDDTMVQYVDTSLIKLITGPRRAGKSVMALQLLSGRHFAYLNFDDDQLLKNFNEDAVIQTLREVYGNFTYLMLDEIQNLTGWEVWVTKLYRRGINLLITGSNARLLSHEMATSLTGRYLQIPVFPFSFTEVLKCREIVIPENGMETPLNLGNILHQLEQYLHNGGFPETVLNPLILKNYLSSLFDSILLKDILKRFRIRQTQQLLDLSNYLLTNYTNLFSYNQIRNDLNFNSVATVRKFIDYLQEPYLFFCLARYTSKIKTQQKAPVKTYVIDNGFIQARSFEMTPNTGRMLENAIFIELLRRNYRPGLELFYYRTRNDREVDFILRKGHTVEQLIQVCHDISGSKTLKRELDALAETSGELSCGNLLLITWDHEEKLEKNGKIIQIIPAWKWLIKRPTTDD